MQPLVDQLGRSAKTDTDVTTVSPVLAPPVFHQPWWLEAVAPGAWGYATVESNGGPVAHLPYVASQRWGLKYLAMPPLTQVLGPWLRPSNAKQARRLSQDKDLLSDLISQLPPHDYFAQSFHHSITYWLPFYWAGFQQTTYYTYVLDDLTDTGSIWDGFLANIRTDIRKAEKQLQVRDDLGVEHFLDISALTFARHGRSLPYPRETVIRIDAAASSRTQRKIYFAVDAEGRTHSAVYILWDEHSAYYLMGGADPGLRNSGATSLLLWQAIQDAAQYTQAFDFEGSMVQPIERFFRAFGAKPKPYFHVWRMSPRFHALWQAREALRAVAHAGRGKSVGKG